MAMGFSVYITVVTMLSSLGDSDVHKLLVEGKPVLAHISNTYPVMEGTPFLTTNLTPLSPNLALP